MLISLYWLSRTSAISRGWIVTIALAWWKSPDDGSEFFFVHSKVIFDDLVLELVLLSGDLPPEGVHQIMTFVKGVNQYFN